MAPRSRRLAAIAILCLLPVVSSTGHASEIVFACIDRDTAIEVAELANEYHLHVLEVGRVTIAERHGFGEMVERAKHRAEVARTSGVCAFVPSFPHRFVATVNSGPEGLAAAGLLRRVHEVVSLESGETFYLIGMEQRPAQP